MAGFLTAAAAAIGSSGIGGALVRILVAYGVSKLINKATGKDNSKVQADEGVRLQLAPDTTNPIPLVFGSAYLGGKITDAQIADANQTMWYCLTVAEVPTVARLSDSAAITTSFDEIYWNNQRVYFKPDGITIDYIVNQDGVVDTSPRDLVKIYLYKNGNTNPVLPSDLGTYVNPLPAVPGSAHTLMPGWTSASAMTNLAFALVKITYNRDKGVTGLPDLQFKLSNNLFKPGDAMYSYMRNPVSGCNFIASQIDTASLIALNNYADDTISYLDEEDNTVKTLANRYQINGIVNPSDNVMNNLQKLASNAGCFLNYDIATGLWGVTINRDVAPVLAFNDSNIISGINLSGTDLDNMYNSVEVEFPHRQLRDQIDSIRIDLPDEFRNANEPDNVLKIRLDLLNEPLQARSLGYLELYQNRMDQVITFTSDYSKINTEAGDVISVTNAIYGWTDQPFRVVRVREVEGEDGGLAVEITAQEYDATMYTAGGQPRRPRVPSEAIGIPGIGVIGTPNAPTTTLINKVAVPAIDITGLTPSGIVDVFEYWVSSDAGTTYRVLGSRRNANGAPYNQGTSLVFRAANLASGNYLFKVRGGNGTVFGPFSAATASTAWAPVQVTDQVTENTKIETPSLGDLLPVLGMGAIAYFAYKAFAPDALAALSQTDLGKLLGITDPADIVAAETALEQQSAAFRIVNAGNVSFSAGVDDTLTLIAGSGITISAVDIGHEITISASGASGPIDALSDVDTTTNAPALNAFLKWNGVNWVPSVTAPAGGTVTVNPSSIISGTVNVAYSTTITASGGTGPYTFTITSGTPGNDMTLSAGGILSGVPTVASIRTFRVTATDSTSPTALTGYRDYTLVIGQANNEGSISVDFDSELDFIMDNCQQLALKLPRRIKRRGTAATQIQLPRRYITNGGTQTLTCYSTSMPTLTIPNHGTTIASQRPLSAGNFKLWAPSFPAIHLKTVNYRVINGSVVIAYCNFNDDGTLISTSTHCATMPPESRPVFSTIEFPSGNRFVTYEMIQAWTPVESGKYPIDEIQYQNVPALQDEYYNQDYTVVQYPRLCRNTSGAAVDYDFNVI